MYKSQLQELCQKKSWSLPVYESVKDGPGHQPRFTATVTVNDATFESPVQCRSSKEAQNAAAQVAFNHFSSLPNAPQQPMIYLAQKYAASGSSALATSLDTEAAKSAAVEQKRQGGLLPAEVSTSIKEDLLHTYKNRLQMYAQKRNLALPAYSCETIGSPHERVYKCKVTVDGKSFETPNFFSTLKDAEHGAAKVAFESMSLHLTEEDKVLYKILLQEHAQRKGLRLPIYDTQKSGPVHMPLFISTVEVGGKSFQGQEAKTKKAAEMNAAKAAYICLIKCQKPQSSNYSVGETSEVSSFNSQPDLTVKVEPDLTVKAGEDVARKRNSQSPNFSGGETLVVSSFNLQPDVTGKVEDYVARKNNISSKEQARKIEDNNGKRHRNSTTSEDAHSQLRGSSTSKSPPQDPKDGASLPTLQIVIPPAQASVKRILVCPRTPDIIIPEGATILPSSDDQWMAMAMSMPEEECEEYYN